MSADSLTLFPENAKLLEQLGGAEVWRQFLLCTQIPRPSKHMQPITDHLVAVAEHWKLEHEIDKTGNVVIRLPATPGKEHVPSVVIQAHMDMVPSNNSDITHDWKKDPLKLVIDGDKLKASGTTLGADDGIGIAGCLAVCSPESPMHAKGITAKGHGPVECLFTVDEEDDMSGAEFIAPAPFVRSKMLINVDSEEEGAICVGCAGGFEVKFFAPVTRTGHVCAGDHAALTIGLKGLLGGHTGCDIHLGRGNALKLLARVIEHVRSDENVKGDVLLHTFNAGTAINAIPREAEAVLLLAPSDVAAAKAAVTAEVDIIRQEYQSTEVRNDASAILCDMQDGSGEGKQACTDACTGHLLALIRLGPHGPVRMSADIAGLTETSIALPIVKLEAADAEMYLHFFARSSSDDQMKDVRAHIKALALLGKARLEPADAMLNYFPGWMPNPKSAILKITEAAHTAVLGYDGRVYAVHAGLECGFLAKSYPDMDQVSIGPTITDAHSPDEAVHIPTVQRFMDLLCNVLERIAE